MEPPEGLNARSRDLWVKLSGKYKTIGQRLLLEQLLRQLTWLDKLDTELGDQQLSTSARSGLTRIDAGVRLRSQHLQSFIKLARTLGLNWQTSYSIDLD